MSETLTYDGVVRLAQQDKANGLQRDVQKLPSTLRETYAANNPQKK